MKKLSNTTQHDGRTRRPPREVRLHALIFGGAASATTPPGGSLPRVAGSHDGKYPNAASE